jgi:AraC-like DNA-binding protein
MSYRRLYHKLATLEAAAAAAYERYLQSLTDAELATLCGQSPPELRAAFAALTDAELELVRAGRLTNADILRRHARRRSQRRELE